MDLGVALPTANTPLTSPAARIADRLNPIGISYEILEGAISSFRAAATAAGRDPAQLPIMVRVNQAIAPKPLPGETRPFLGGAPEQIAADLARLRPLDVDHVFFATGYAPSLDGQVQLLERLQRAVQSGGG